MEKNIYKSYKNLLAFFRYRNYKGIQEEYKNFEDFNELLSKANDFYLLKLKIEIEYPNDIIVYFFANEINISHVNRLIDEIKQSPEKHFIIVHDRPLASKSKEELNRFILISQKIRIEIFKYNEIIIDVTVNKNNPRHEILTQNEITELLQVYGLESKERLPSITFSATHVDKMVKIVGAQRGDVLRIRRKPENETIYSVTEVIYYRHVTS